MWAWSPSTKLSMNASTPDESPPGLEATNVSWRSMRRATRSGVYPCAMNRSTTAAPMRSVYVARQAVSATSRIAGASSGTARRTTTPVAVRSVVSVIRGGARRAARARPRGRADADAARRSGPPALTRATAMLISVTRRSSAARSRRRTNAESPPRPALATIASRRASRSRTSLSASIQGGATPAFRRTWKAIAMSPAYVSSATGSRSPAYGRSSNLPCSIASRIWRSTRLSHVGATWRSPCSSMRLGGFLPGSTAAV